MTSTVDVPTVAAPAIAATAPTAAGDPSAHVMRLCLDLQLDAMLLALGTAANHSQAPGTTEATGKPAAGTWQRWMVEDLQMVRALAVDVVRGGATLPPTFGAEADRPSRTTVDQLAARYESMVTLLAGLADAAGRPEAGRHSAGRDTVGRAALVAGPVDEALDRCRRRLLELSEAGRPAATRGSAPAPAPAPLPPRAFLPGELLG
jgi:hypothetical protein